MELHFGVNIGNKFDLQIGNTVSIQLGDKVSGQNGQSTDLTKEKKSQIAQVHMIF